jgi:hypothetical protein
MSIKAYPKHYKIILNSADARYASDGSFTWDVNLPLFDSIHERSGWVVALQSFFSTPTNAGVFVGNTQTNVYANIHIREFAQMTSYSSKTRHFTTIIATFTDRSFISDVAKETVAIPVDENWWINKQITVFFSDNLMNQITTPETARFQITLNMWNPNN